MDDDMKEKVWENLKFYNKSKTRIKITYNNITVSGIIIKMHKWWTRSYAILDADGVQHKIFIEDIRPGTIFPNKTKIEKHFINPSHNRKSIPKSIKNQIWRDRFADRFYGKCDVCRNNIRKDNFEAGHVISARDGGSDTPDNLRPICRSCNRSMGTQNLKDFKREFYAN